MIKTIEQYALEQECQQIKKVCLAVGLLAGIDIEALRFSFPIAAKNSVVDKAELEIESIAGKAHCRVCRQDFTLMQYLQACPKCNGYEYDIMQGKELKILNIIGASFVPPGSS